MLWCVQVLRQELSCCSWKIFIHSSLSLFYSVWIYLFHSFNKCKAFSALWSLFLYQNIKSEQIHMNVKHGNLSKTFCSKLVSSQFVCSLPSVSTFSHILPLFACWFCLFCIKGMVLFEVGLFEVLIHSQCITWESARSILKQLPALKLSNEELWTGHSAAAKERAVWPEVRWRWKCSTLKLLCVVCSFNMWTPPTVANTLPMDEYLIQSCLKKTELSL